MIFASQQSNIFFQNEQPIPLTIPKEDGAISEQERHDSGLFDEYGSGLGLMAGNGSSNEAQEAAFDRVAAEEVNLNLHWVTHPAEDIDIIPTLLVIVTRWIIVDTYLVIVLGYLHRYHDHRDLAELPVSGLSQE